MSFIIIENDNSSTIEVVGNGEYHVVKEINNATGIEVAGLLPTVITDLTSNVDLILTYNIAKL